ncbi:unnamed protein product [Closterium sp. Naga37s-1]|nr:unnamed protein product [Closterium sp. Naga37s-1]
MACQASVGEAPSWGEQAAARHRHHGGGGPSGSFAAFEAEAGAVLEFIYNTQLEHAACSEVECVTMDGSAESYSLLGDYGAGQQLYRVHMDTATGQRCLEFCSLLPFHQAVVGTAQVAE